jgi:hypothetical protein
MTTCAHGTAAGPAAYGRLGPPNSAFGYGVGMMQTARTTKTFDRALTYAVKLGCVDA